MGLHIAGHVIEHDPLEPGHVPLPPEMMEKAVALQVFATDLMMHPAFRKQVGDIAHFQALRDERFCTQMELRKIVDKDYLKVNGRRKGLSNGVMPLLAHYRTEDPRESEMALAIESALWGYSVPEHRVDDVGFALEAMVWLKERMEKMQETLAGGGFLQDDPRKGLSGKVKQVLASAFGR